MIDLSRYKMRETREAVYFFGGPPSQWYLKAPFRQRFKLGGKVYAFRHAEQYMMAAKALMFGDMDIFDQIMAETEPARVKAQGRKVRGMSTPRWTDEDKALWQAAVPGVLIHGNVAKFSQNPDILEWLLSTAGKQLVEGSPTDRIYGVGIRYDDPRIEEPANWKGLNLLGVALAIVRDRLAK
jgi:ribA/ribD-fused uncharacterized protein